MFGGGIAAIKTCVCLLWNMDKIHCHVDAQGPANKEGTVLYKTVQWWCMLVGKYLALHLQVFGPANPGQFWIHAQGTIGPICNPSSLVCLDHKCLQAMR